MAVERVEIIELLKSVYLFKKTSDAQLELVLNQFNKRSYTKGECIFIQGKPAANLYLLIQGQVEISQLTPKGKRKVGELCRGDVFGFEMLEYENKCLTTATALGDCTVLWLDRNRTRLLLQNIETLNLDLKILYESYLLALNTPMTWKESGETIHFIARRHPMHVVMRLLPVFLWALISFSAGGYAVYVFPGLLTPLLVLGLCILVAVLWGVWTVVDWMNDFSILTNSRLVYQEKILMLYDNRQETPLQAVLSVTTETDWLGRRFSYGNVIVRSYAGQIILPKLSNPRQVGALIETQVELAKSGLVEVERSKIDDLLREKIGLKEPSETVQAAASATPVRTGWLLASIANLFRLRYTQGDVTIYRTHWFILVKRVFLPTLILLGLAAALILRLGQGILFPSLSAMLGLVLVGGTIVGLWWLYNYIDWRNDHYVITPDQLVDVNRKPFGREERRAAPLKNVLSIEFQRLGVIGLLLNFGTVYIRVGETTLTFDFVFNPAEVQRELFSRLAAYQYRQRLEEKRAADKNIADWIESYHRMLETEKKSKDAAQDSEEQE